MKKFYAKSKHFGNAKTKYWPNGTPNSIQLEKLGRVKSPFDQGFIVMLFHKKLCPFLMLKNLK